MADVAVNFDQLVRIFVDTDVDTHFIVSVSRTSTVAELRELVKQTHRHCYPAKGDVDIGNLVVPGGDYGYHLADFLRIGQVYDKFEGKILAEVKSCDPVSSNRERICRIPALSFTNSLMPKKVPLLAPQPFEYAGERGALLAVESNLVVPRIELKEPKLQKEEFDGDANCVCVPLDLLPSKVSVLAVESIGEEDEKVVAKPGTALCDGGSDVLAADLATKVSGSNPDVCVEDVHLEPDKISERATPALTFHIKGVTSSRKREASVSNERPSKSRRLNEPAPSGSTSTLRKENGRLEVRNGAMQNIVNDVNESTGASLSLTNPSGDIGSNPLSTSAMKRKRKRKKTEADLTFSQNQTEAVKDALLELEAEEEMCDAKNGEIVDTGLAVGLEVEGSGIVGLEVGRDEKSDSLPEGSGVSLSPRLKEMEKPERNEDQKQELKKEQKQELKKGQKQELKKNQKQELKKDQKQELKKEQTQELKKEQTQELKKDQKQDLNQEHNYEQNQESTPTSEMKKKKKKKKTKKKKKKSEITPVVSASLNHLAKESEREYEQENGRCSEADVSPALVNSGHCSGLMSTSPNHSQHVINNEKVDNIEVNDVEEKRTFRRLKKKGSTAAAAVAVDASNQKGSQDSGGPAVVKFLKDEASENETSRREAQISKETSGEGTDQNGNTLDDKAFLPKINLFSTFNGVESSTSHKGGAGASLHTQATRVGSGRNQEISNPSKGAGRGAPSETRNSDSSEDVNKGREGVDPEASGIQSLQGSEKSKQHSRSRNKGSEVSAAQMHQARGKVKRSASHSESNSRHIVVSAGKVAQFSVERLETQPGHVDQLKVAKPDKVAQSRTCSEDSSAESPAESSAESDPRSADHAEVRSQEDADGTPDSVTSPEKHASTSPRRAEGGEILIKNDSLQFFSQDQSFQVAPTQVQKAISGNSTEDSSDESDTNPDKTPDELKKQKPDNLRISDKGVGESEESSDESEDNPPLTAKSPVPLGVTGGGGIQSSQVFKRRASGVTAEIEAKFAHFIDSQDGLDELMGITLGQRKRSMPIDPSTQAGSLATNNDSPLDSALNTRDSARNSSMALPGGLERYQAIDLGPASQNSAEKSLNPQFKVPKPVPIGKVLGTAQGVFGSAAPAVQSTGKEVPMKAEVPKTVKDLRLKRKEPVKQDEKQNDTNCLPEKNNDASPLPIHETAKETLTDDQDAGGSKQKPSGIYNLLSTPEVLKETFRNDLSAALDTSTAVKKTSVIKRLKEPNPDSQFMIVNNTDHISEHVREDSKFESEDETKGPSCLNEETPTKSVKNSKELRVQGEDVEMGGDGSRETTGFDTSAKKKRKNQEDSGGKERKKRKLDDKEVSDLPETSVDRSARETEELYLKLEQAKKDRDQWQQKSVSSFKKDEEKRNSLDAVEGEDVAQSRLEAGEAQIDDTENDNVKEMSDTLVDVGNPAECHQGPDLLCAGNTEASDRQDSGFLSQDENAEASSQQDKTHDKVQDKIQDRVEVDVFDFVSEDETPMKTSVSKSAKKSAMKEGKAKHLDNVASRAVQRVLEDEMLSVMDSNSGKKSRTEARPVKWTVRMRGSPGSALATSVHGGTIPSDANDPSPFTSTPGDLPGRGAPDKRGFESTAKTPRAPRAPPKARAPPKPKTVGSEPCPLGCGRVYSSKTSAYYSHKKICTAAPAE